MAFHRALVTHPWFLLPGQCREHLTLTLTLTSGASGPWPGSSPGAPESCTHLPHSQTPSLPRHWSWDSLSTGSGVVGARADLPQLHAHVGPQPFSPGHISALPASSWPPAL